MKGLRLRRLNSREVKHINALCEQWYGITLPKGAYFLQEKQKDVYLLSQEAADFDSDNLRVNNAGMYIANLSSDEKSLRLSIEGSQILGPKAQSHVYNLAKEHLKAYLFGDDIAVAEDAPTGWHIVRCGDDFIGCALIKEGNLRNFMPKARKISDKS